MKAKHIISIVATLFVVLVSCSKDDTKTESEGDNPLKSLSLSSQEQEFVNPGNRFALRLLDDISDRYAGSVVFSPLSMQFLLGMSLNGAQGETADQISNVLGFGAGQTATVNQYFLSLIKQLPDLDKKTTLAFANAVYANKNHQLLETFKNSLGQYYEADVSNVDFSDKETLSKINSWCSKHTKSLIPSIIDDLTGAELAVLLNATYFKSSWKSPFKEENTSEKTFTLEDGNTKRVPMMAMKEDFIYTENENYCAVNLPYGNNSYSMTVFLPSEGKTLADVTESLRDLDMTTFFGSSWANYQVDLWLPRFEIKFNINLKEILSEMGMPNAFDRNKANFKSMSDIETYLDLVQQNTVIKVNERGTEAVSVSSGKWMPTAPPPLPSTVFHADRPFVYFISERSSKAILFAGKYTGK